MPIMVKFLIRYKNSKVLILLSLFYKIQPLETSAWLKRCCHSNGLFCYLWVKSKQVNIQRSLISMWWANNQCSRKRMFWTNMLEQQWDCDCYATKIVKTKNRRTCWRINKQILLSRYNIGPECIMKIENLKYSLLLANNVIVALVLIEQNCHDCFILVNTLYYA